MTHAKNYMMFLIVGIFAYWAPDVLIHLVQPPQGLWIVLLALLVPTIVFIAWRRLCEHSAYSEYQVGIPLLMLFGVWLFGPLGIALGALPSSEGFIDANNIWEFFQLWAKFPLPTFVMSMYSGSLGGLGITTLMLLIGAAVAVIKRIASVERTD